VIIFIFISIGFSAAFHMLYDNLPIYADLFHANFHTFTGIFSGYHIPDSSWLLFYPNAFVGFIFQVLCILIGIVMLINFLIAMMNSVYTQIQVNSKQEYRWIMTRDITQVQETAWPVPLNLLQLVVVAVLTCWCCKITVFNEEIDKESERRSNDKKDDVFLEKKKKLYANMAISYFRETMKEDE